MNKRQQHKILHRHRSIAWPLLAVIVLFAIGGLGYVLFTPTSTEAPGSIETPSSQADEPVEEEVEAEDTEPLPSVQAELDEVLASLRGSHSVVVRDLATGEELASHQPSDVFFTASIYKLYVAYLALLDIQAGVHDPDESYNQGRTRMECIVVMLRDSDSPCPEQMWQEQGRDIGTTRLEDLGLTGTDLIAITTTASDATMLMERLYNRQDLGEEYTGIMLDSLRDFPEREFRQGLPSALDGFSDVAVYDKPGIYDEGWLDAAIVVLPSGRSVAISIFSDSAYYQEVRSITRAVVAPLLQQ